MELGAKVMDLPCQIHFEYSCTLKERKMRNPYFIVIYPFYALNTSDRPLLVLVFDRYVRHQHLRFYTHSN